MSDTTSASLLLRLRDHSDERAWQTFSDIYGPLVSSYCLQRGMSNHDAADVAQEVLLRVSKSIRQFEYDRSRGRFRGWLFKIIQNELARFRSRDARQPLAASDVGADIGNPASESAAQWNEHFQHFLLKTAMQRIRDRFEESTWRAFELVWIEQKSAADAAALLEKPLDFVYRSKSRVLKRLRLEIEILAEDTCF